MDRKVINRIKHFFPSSVLISLYNTLILSYLNYGILAWGNCSISNLHKLLILQKWALRMINSVDFYTNADRLFIKHRTLKIKDIYYHQLGSLMYQSVFNTLTTFINASFTWNNEIHTHSTGQALHSTSH